MATVAAEVGVVRAVEVLGHVLLAAMARTRVGVAAP
jgi:hypothetical protein